MLKIKNKPTKSDNISPAQKQARGISRDGDKSLYHHPLSV